VILELLLNSYILKRALIFYIIIIFCSYKFNHFEYALIVAFNLLVFSIFESIYCVIIFFLVYYDFLNTFIVTFLEIGRFENIMYKGALKSYRGYFSF